jgi:hypothetical protein
LLSSSSIGGFPRVKTTAISPFEKISEISNKSYSEFFQTISQHNFLFIAVDPDSLNPDTDPDPAFQVNPDPDAARIHSFYDQKLKEKKYCKIFFKYLSLIKNCNLLIPRPP